MNHSRSRKQAGFTIIEIMAAVGIFAIVALAITYLVTDSFTRTVQIADAARCNEVLDSAFATVDGFGSSLDPLEAVFDPDEDVRTQPAANSPRGFVTDWTPLPMRMNIGGNTYYNNFQKLRSSTAALLAIYNTEGSANLYPGDYSYPRTENLIVNQFGKLESRNAEFRIRIRPVDQSGSAVNIPSPLGINPTFDQNAPENQANDLGITRWRDDLGMELDIRLLYTDNQGTPQECSRSKAYYFQHDGVLTPNIANGTNLYVGPIDTSAPFAPSGSEAAMQPIPWLANESYGCSSDEVTLRLDMSAAQIEPASVVMCRARILDDPGTSGDESALEPATPWTACANVTLGGTVTTYSDPGPPRMYVYHVQNARTNVTYVFEIAVLDSAGNQVTHSETFSLDTERPSIVFFDETTSNLVNPLGSLPPASNTRRSGSWSPQANTSQVQCGAGAPQFTARIQGSLLSKTGVLEVGSLAALHPDGPALTPREICEFDSVENERTQGLYDPASVMIQPMFSGPNLTGYQCSINTVDINPNGYRHIVFRSGDLCGLHDDQNGPPTNTPENADAVFGLGDSRYDFLYADMSEPLSFNTWNSSEGAPADKTDEYFEGSISNAVLGLTALYCVASNVHVDNPPYRCDVEPGEGDDGVGPSPDPGTNLINPADERGQTVGRIYDICTNYTTADGDANRVRDSFYCDAGQYYTQEVCALHLTGSSVCVEVGTTNCWIVADVCTGTAVWGGTPDCPINRMKFCSGGGNVDTPCCEGDSASPCPGNCNAETPDPLCNDLNPINTYFDFLNTTALNCEATYGAGNCIQDPESGCWTECTQITTTTSITTTTGGPACLDSDPQPWGAEPLCAKADRGWCSGGNDEPCCRTNGANCPAGELCSVLIPGSCNGGPELWGEQNSPFVPAKDVCENFSGTSCYGSYNDECFTYCGNSTYPINPGNSAINIRVQGWGITSATASPGSVSVAPLQCAYGIDNFPAGSLGSSGDAPVNIGNNPATPPYGSPKMHVVPKGTVITLKGWQMNSCYPHEGWRNYTGGSFGGSFTSCPSGSDTNGPQGSRDCTFTATEDEYYLEYNANSRLGGCSVNANTYAIPAASGCTGTCIDRDDRNNCCLNVAGQVRFPQAALTCPESGTRFCYERQAECNSTGNGGSPCPSTCTE